MRSDWWALVLRALFAVHVFAVVPAVGATAAAEELDGETGTALSISSAKTARVYWGPAGTVSLELAEEFPNSVGVSHGWVVEVETDLEELRWSETLIYPPKCGVPGDRGFPPGARLVTNQRRRTTEGRSAVREGLIGHLWLLAEDSCTGIYELRVKVEEKALAPLRFEIIEQIFSYKQYYVGLPDFASSPPFDRRDRALDKKLHQVVRDATSTEGCDPRDPGDRRPGLRRLCKLSDEDHVQGLLASMAPSLARYRLEPWLTDLDADFEQELLVAYTVTSEDEYLSVWRFKWGGDNYQISFSGHFLEGALHAMTRFAGPAAPPKLVVRYASCTECHPWIYLAFVDFGSSPIAQPFLFTYSADHDGWKPWIEHVLPGSGHSVEAGVDSRIPAAGIEGGPHLIQHFLLETGREEWLVFRCDGYRCDHDGLRATLPTGLMKAWKAADRSALGRP